MKPISVVLPVYNESGIIASLIEELEKNISNAEFVVINDCSTDNTLDVLKAYQPVDGNSLKIVDLTRNFGHQTALLAGLHHVRESSELVIVMDADFQDLPVDVPKLVEKLETDNLDCAYGVRTANSGSAMVDMFTSMFYRLQGAFYKFTIPEHAGTFCVFNRNFLNQLLKFTEFDIYFPGIRAYVGLKQDGVELSRGERKAGDSKVGVMGLIGLSVVGLFGFSQVPLRLIFLLGLLTFVINMALGLLVFLLKIFSITTIPGVTTVLIVMLAFFGLQMMCIGVLGEYVGKLYQEAKGRPRFLVADVYER